MFSKTKQAPTEQFLRSTTEYTNWYSPRDRHSKPIDRGLRTTGAATTRLRIVGYLASSATRPRQKLPCYGFFLELNFVWNWSRIYQNQGSVEWFRTNGATVGPIGCSRLSSGYLQLVRFRFTKRWISVKRSWSMIRSYRSNSAFCWLLRRLEFAEAPLGWPPQMNYELTCRKNSSRVLKRRWRHIQHSAVGNSRLTL